MSKISGMVWTWAGWEPVQFYRRLGGYHECQEANPLWLEDWSRTLHSERTAKALAEAGINWVTTHFFKGFGLDSEREEMAQASELVQKYHRHGINVFFYIQYGSLMPETLSTVWGREDYSGQHNGPPYEYGDQYWRRKPCANQPGFRPYLARVIRQAVSGGADGIWIDNLQADGCHCAHCQKAFQKYLTKNVKDPQRDLGVSNLAHVRIPRGENLRDPVFQRWICCRQEETATSLRFLSDVARKLKPDMVLCVNIGIGNTQRHLIENGNWYSALTSFDYTYAENHLLPAWENGQVLTQHFPAKLMSSLGGRIVPGGNPPLRRVGYYPRAAMPDERTLRRVFAESAFFGGHAAGGPWGLRGENGGADPAWLQDAEARVHNRRLADFYRSFEPGVDASEVGLLYSFEGMGWDEPDYKIAFRAMEQLLLQHQIPFRYVLSDQLEHMGELKLLVLPHVLCMSNAMAKRLSAFVQKGGRLLATGRTSLYDEWMRQRQEYALADVFGVSFSDNFEEAHLDRVLTNKKNGCVFFPGEWALDEARKPQDAALVRAIRRIVPPIIDSPAPHVVCSLRRQADGSQIVGLINYADHPVRNVRLHLGKGQEACAWSVDQKSGPIRAGQLPELTCEMIIHLTNGRRHAKRMESNA